MKHLEPKCALDLRKYILDLIPFLEETFKNHSLYIGMESKHRVKSDS